MDAGRLAAQLGVKNLLLYHTEDKTLATRKERYTAEAASQFSGKVYVPEDLEEIYYVVMNELPRSSRSVTTR